jgi:hypothetical protein|tara:strand:+ start:436 stop:648 length:213 start_codon:yes stop_codon:yes gene_type:complete
MDEIKKASSKHVQTVETHLTALQDLNHVLSLQLNKTEYMSSSFIKKDLVPRLKDLILQTSALITVSQLEY